MTNPYDFVVIGGGSGGYAAARTAHAHGMKTAVIDNADTLGGLCILSGCMPSKTLIESANRCRSMRRAEEYGLRSGVTEFYPDEIIARKRKLIDEFAEYRQKQLGDGRFDLIRGKASFTGKNSLEIALIDGGTPIAVEFRAITVATGSKIARLPLQGLEEAGYWTSDDILEAEEIPDSVVVLGGGAIALEMACYLEGLGTEVTVIQRSSQLVRGSDLDVAKALESSLSLRENMTIFTGTVLNRVETDEYTGLKTVFFEHEGEEKSATAHQILQALGRRPNTVSLNGEAAGLVIEKHSGRVICREDQRSGPNHLFAAGDVCGPHEVVHIAIEQGEIAAHNAAVMLGFLDEPEKKIDYRLKLYGIFTDPQIAMVGMTEAEAREVGREIKVASYPFDDHGKSMVMGEIHGFVKMIGDAKTEEILGASVIGPEAAELIHEIVVAMHFRATASEFIKIPHYHPTLSEIWTYPAEDLLISG